MITDLVTTLFKIIHINLSFQIDIIFLKHLSDGSSFEHILNKVPQMKKSSYLQKDLESEFEIDNVLIPETHSSDYSLSELSKGDDYGIITDDEENMGCQLRERSENDVIDLFGNKIIDDFQLRLKIKLPISVDISLYPLKEDFIPPIDDFIASLKAYKSIEVRTGNMSTKIFGEYDVVMHALKEELFNTFCKEVNVVFNIKIVNGDSRVYD